jgi:hypothetical protein
MRAEGLELSFIDTPPASLSVLIRMIGGGLSGNEAGVLFQRIGSAKGHPDLPLAEVFSECPVARHFVCLVEKHLGCHL